MDPHRSCSPRNCVNILMLFWSLQQYSDPNPGPARTGPDLGQSTVTVLYALEPGIDQGHDGFFIAPNVRRPTTTKLHTASTLRKFHLSIHLGPESLLSRQTVQLLVTVWLCSAPARVLHLHGSRPLPFQVPSAPERPIIAEIHGHMCAPPTT